MLPNNPPRTLNACGRCGLSNLSPGASHPNADACVDALRAALDAKVACACGMALPPKCPTCYAKGLAADHGKRFLMEKAGPVLLEWLAKQQQGGPAS